VWFDAVIGYLSASVEWARRTGDPDAWRPFWDGSADARYFMGKDNVVFHSVIWPAILLGASGKPAGTPGPLGELALPTEVVSSEFLTMEGRKFSSSRSVVIYVRDVLERYGADPLRYYLSVAGPESSDTDFTWEQFVTRNNTELVAGWGNLVNRSLNLVASNGGAIPGPGELTGEDQRALEASRAAFATVGAHLDRSQQKAAITEAMRVVGEANKYLSDQAPWKLKDDPARRDSVLHVALQLVDDAKALLTPFLPESCDTVDRMLGGDRPGRASRSCARSRTSTGDRATRC
jgi:methionyl-tRNA synthetase